MTNSPSSTGIRTDLLPPSLVSCERAALERVENGATQAATRHPSPQEIKVNNQDLTSCSPNPIILRSDGLQLRVRGSKCVTTRGRRPTRWHCISRDNIWVGRIFLIQMKKRLKYLYVMNKNTFIPDNGISDITSRHCQPDRMRPRAQARLEAFHRLCMSSLTSTSFPLNPPTFCGFFYSISFLHSSSPSSPLASPSGALRLPCITDPDKLGILSSS